MNRIWHCCHHSFPVGPRTLMMGIVNVTPDSFSDGGQFFDPRNAIEQGYRLLEEGADIVDIGGASSRPGAEPVPVEEELRRILPVVEEIAGKAEKPVSIDTIWHSVAAACIEAGASIINDISGLQNDPRLAALAAECGAGLVIMHMRGTPQTMQSMTDYANLIKDVRSFFQSQVQVARLNDVKDDQIVLDPGIGFSKTAEQNIHLLHRLQKLKLDSFPLLLGVSNKSFIGRVLQKEVQDRDFGTAGAVAVSIMNGADIVRVHNVKAMRDVADMVDAIAQENIEIRTGS